MATGSIRLKAVPYQPEFTLTSIGEQYFSFHVISGGIIGNLLGMSIQLITKQNITTGEKSVISQNIRSYGYLTSPLVMTNDSSLVGSMLKAGETIYFNFSTNVGTGKYLVFNLNGIVQ